MLQTNILLLFITIVVLSCNNGPKEMTPVSSDIRSTNQTSTGVFDTSPKSESPNESKASSIEKGLHTVKVKEVLPTDKYVYLLVNENDEEYWIATKKQEVNVGEVYFYKNGLLKTNFESKEYNRVFDKVYLVSNITPANHGQRSIGTNGNKKKEANMNLPQAVKRLEGSLTIKEVVENPKKYEGKTIQLTGTCVKVNPNIMNRNWIHLKDGSQDDYDFVVTSEIMVPEGHVISLKGVLSLNKDFGSGYRYDMILENGELIK